MRAGHVSDGSDHDGRPPCSVGNRPAAHRQPNPNHAEVETTTRPRTWPAIIRSLQAGTSFKAISVVIRSRRSAGNSRASRSHASFLRPTGQVLESIPSKLTPRRINGWTLVG